MGKVYLINEDSLVDIADGIRELNGATESLSLNDISDAIKTEKANIDEALMAVANKGVIVPEGSGSVDLASLVSGIEGTPLNFQVVACASEDELPSNPVENTIAVITETPITGWSFAVTEPATPYTGMVWLRTSTNLATSFNALRKNELFVYMDYVKQYIGGTWVSKDAQLFKNGAWHGLFSGVLYDSGDEYTNYTGGWEYETLVYMSYGGAYGKGTVQKNADSIYLYTYDSTQASVVTQNKIDISKYSTLNLDYSGFYDEATGWKHFALLSGIGKFEEVAVASTKISAANGQVAIDVSNITGNYYVGVVINTGDGTTTKLTINKIWLE